MTIKTGIGEKVAAQENFEDQVDIAETHFLRLVIGEEDIMYALSNEELERLKAINIEATLRNFSHRFDEHCRQLYGPRWIGRYG